MVQQTFQTDEEAPIVRDVRISAPRRGLVRHQIGQQTEREHDEGSSEDFDHSRNVSFYFDYSSKGESENDGDDHQSWSSDSKSVDSEEEKERAIRAGFIGVIIGWIWNTFSKNFYPALPGSLAVSSSL